MSTIFLILAAVTMLAVLSTLATGLIAMARGDQFNARHGNRLMRWRIALQGLALLFFALAMLTR